MTLKEVAYDVMMLGSKLRLKDDSRLNEKDYIEYLINEHRASQIRDTYNRNRFIESVWIQDMGTLTTTKVDVGEDSSVDDCGCLLGKITLPPVVQFKNGSLGVQRISSICKSKTFYPTSHHKFTEILKSDSSRKNKCYYFIVGNSYYIYPYMESINAKLILQDPREGFVIQNESIPTGSLVTGTVYKVTSGSIVHNSVTYQNGNTFTAVNADYTGDGTVKYNVEKRAFTENDEYPAGSKLIEFVKKEIFRVEFPVERSSISDNKNDGEDEVVKRDNRQI